jgi:Ni/Fe-hydrogenase subunit HybB-like protein
MAEHYKTLKSQHRSYWALLILLVLFVISGYSAAHFMESQGHWVSGMNNQVVWGLPHVFAIFLILSASGALNVASMGSVFNRQQYKTWSRFSGLLAICLLIGGLLVLVLDLGRPERLIVAMTHYNFRSIFAWNIFLYIGFIVLVGIYLWVQFENSLSRYTAGVGLFALIWRFVLTSGTGGIFGFLVSRQLYDAAMIIPVFITLSLVLGTALFIILEKVIGEWSGGSQLKASHEQTRFDLSRLLGIFVALQVFLVLAFHLTNLYTAEHQGVENFILFGGGIYTQMFWLGQIGLGACLPLALLFYKPSVQTTNRIMLACVSVVVGAFCQLYVFIIGGQVFPQILFPGKTVSSSFYDGVIAHYSPALPEYLLGLGGISIALLVLLGVLRVLPSLPDSRIHSN